MRRVKRRKWRRLRALRFVLCSDKYHQELYVKSPDLEEYGPFYKMVWPKTYRANKCT